MKILEYKLNAIMAKSRALYGKRLTGKDYENLLNCSSVGEITSYLREDTAYSIVLQKYAASDVSPGRLEFLLKRTQYEVFSVISRYEIAFGQELYKYFVCLSETEFILSRIKSMLFGTGAEHAVTMPKLYKGSTDIDVYAVTKAHTPQELSDILSQTPYKDVIEKCLKGGAIDYTDYECAFTAFLHEYEYELLKKNCKKNSGLVKLLSRNADTRFINGLYRIKKYFPFSGDRILRSISPSHLTDFSKSQITKLLNAVDENELLTVLRGTVYGDYAEKIANSDYPEQAIAQLDYENYRHRLRFSTDPDEVMFCLMFLIDTEISNLIHIIEGVKYKLDASGIKKMLIGVGN